MNSKKENKISKLHRVEKLQWEKETLKINIDGQDHQFKLKNISKRLLKASELERNTFEISPSGYGIHWPLIDEDLSIDALLGVKHPFPHKLKGRLSA